ncbi:MAG: winged helix-turn-helix transcriptional regulator [Candidatus Lokiarchaeota archaeon]|nr:winged helix-turn-helix transcriptional regulator [Candidatus Lokiarchaeota archaeon]
MDIASLFLTVKTRPLGAQERALNEFDENLITSFLALLCMDETDLKIVLLLFNNSRLSYREISDYLGLSVNAAYKRVQNLVDLKIIEKFTAKIKPYAINALYVFILGQSSTDNIEQAILNLGSHENTWQVILSSRNYLYVGAMLKDVHQLEEYSSFVSRTAMMQSPKIGMLSGVSYDAPIPYIVPRSRSMSYDELDVAIIRALREDSRKPVSEITEEIKSTSSTVRRRLTRLIEEGVIELSINFNPGASNDVFALLQVTLNPSADKNEIARKLNVDHSPNIFYSWQFSNLPNLVLCWVWTNTMKELNEIVESVKKERIESVTFDIMYKVMYFDTWKEKLLFG